MRAESTDYRTTKRESNFTFRHLRALLKRLFCMDVPKSEIKGHMFTICNTLVRCASVVLSPDLISQTHAI